MDEEAGESSPVLRLGKDWDLRHSDRRTMPMSKSAGALGHGHELHEWGNGGTLAQRHSAGLWTTAVIHWGQVKVKTPGKHLQRPPSVPGRNIWNVLGAENCRDQRQACHGRDVQKIAFDTYSPSEALAANPRLDVFSDLWHKLANRGHAKVKMAFQKILLSGRHSLTWIRFSQMSNTGKETVKSNRVT